MNPKLKNALFVAGVIAVVAIVAGLWISHELTIDSCLDRGGRWNGELRSCEGARPK
jgi:hypothetical protein